MCMYTFLFACNGSVIGECANKCEKVCKRVQPYFWSGLAEQQLFAVPPFEGNSLSLVVYCQPNLSLDRRGLWLEAEFYLVSCLQTNRSRLCFPQAGSRQQRWQPVAVCYCYWAFPIHQCNECNGLLVLITLLVMHRHYSWQYLLMLPPVSSSVIVQVIIRGTTIMS